MPETLEVVLESALENKLCDTELVSRMAAAPPVVQGWVLSIAEEYQKRAEAAKARARANRDFSMKLYRIETALVAAEDLTEDAQQKYFAFLQDPKVQRVLDASPQSDLYIDLLVAQAKETLAAFRKQYNGDLAPQRPFQATEVFKYTLGDKQAEQKAAQRNVAERFDRVLTTILKRNPHYLRLQRFENMFVADPAQPISELVETLKHVPGHFWGDFWSAEEKDEGVFFAVGVDQDTIRKIKLFTGYEAHFNGEPLYLEKILELVADFQSREKDTLDLFGPEDVVAACSAYGAAVLEEERQTYHKILGYLVERVRREFLGATESNVTGAGRQDLAELGATREEQAEFAAIKNEASAINNLKASSKLKPGELTYRVTLSKKEPTDVRIGNDAGCCIGVYQSGQGIGNAYGLPHLIADNATYFFNVMQKRGNAKAKRTGMVLGFDARGENGEKILLCNSSELSASMNPALALPGLVNYIEGQIVAFAKQNGFDRVEMGAHRYNTSTNYSSSSTDVHTLVAEKVQGLHQKKFYSEVLDDYGNASGKFYTLWKREV